MKFKLWLRRHSISAPKMTIRSSMSWPARIALFAIVLATGAALAIWLVHPEHGLKKGGGSEEISALMDRVESLNTERDQLSAAVSGAESRLTMERSVQTQLAAQVKTLEAENTKLKEDLAFFESLLPSSANGLGITIRQAKFELLGANQLKYRLLLMQGGKVSNDFVGSLQFVVTLMRDGKAFMINFPERNFAEPEKEKFTLRFKHYQRMEGILTLPDAALAKSVQVRVLEKGQLKAQQSTSL